MKRAADSCDDGEANASAVRGVGGPLPKAHAGLRTTATAMRAVAAKYAETAKPRRVPPPALTMLNETCAPLVEEAAAAFTKLAAQELNARHAILFTFRLCEPQTSALARSAVRPPLAFHGTSFVAAPTSASHGGRKMVPSSSFFRDGTFSEVAVTSSTVLPPVRGGLAGAAGAPGTGQTTLRDDLAQRRAATKQRSPPPGAQRIFRF